jgi:hypothetical protein
MLIFDPGSPYEDEQEALAACVDEMIAEGSSSARNCFDSFASGPRRRCERAQGASRRERSSCRTRANGEALDDVPCDRLIEDNDVITLAGEPQIQLRALHTPGHALGHLCFHDEARGVLMTATTSSALVQCLSIRRRETCATI